MKRTIMTALAAAVALTTAAIPADARGKKSKRVYKAAPYDRTYVQRENSDSPDCIRARALDPGGNYRAYPCWARAALSGNPRTR